MEIFYGQAVKVVNTKDWNTTRRMRHCIKFCWRKPVLRPAFLLHLLNIHSPAELYPHSHSQRAEVLVSAKHKNDDTFFWHLWIDRFILYSVFFPPYYLGSTQTNWLTRVATCVSALCTRMKTSTARRVFPLQIQWMTNNQI